MIPLALRPIQRGNLIFCCRDREYIAVGRHEDFVVYRRSGGEISGNEEYSWAVASALFYFERREIANMAIHNARRRAAKWIIYTIITVPIVMLILSHQ